jgi:cytochrome P450
VKPVSSIELPPSQKPDLIGGHFRSFRKDPTGFLERQAALGDVSYFRLGPQPAYLITDPEMIHDLFVKSHSKFIKGRALQRAKALLGEGLLTSEGAFHLRQRRMIQPAFHRDRIAEYSAVMVDEAARTIVSWKVGEVRDIDKEMMQLTLRIVGRTLFSADVTDEADEIGKAMTTVSLIRAGFTVPAIPSIPSSSA